MSTGENLLTRKGQVTIPAEIRARLGSKSRDRIVFELDGDGSTLRSTESTLLAVYAGVRPLNRPEAYRLLRDRFVENVAAAADVASETESSVMEPRFLDRFRKSWPRARLGR